MEVAMIDRGIRFALGFALLTLMLAATAPAARADVELHSVDWQTLSGTGVVRFHLQWHNPDQLTSSLPVSGQVWAQQFGVFVPNEGLIGSFDVPPIEPESFFDVFIEVPLSSLPQPPEEGHVAKPAQGLPPIPCPPGDHWDGNIDIMWGGPGGSGQVNYHIGQIMVCPGLGRSLIHMIGGCAAAMPWVIQGVCPGWTVSLLNEDLTPAPNPVPAGWTGWIATSANAAVPVGQVCCFSVVFTCGAQSAAVQLCATACQCVSVGVEPNTWGVVKSLYR
jgi:hypothetical protein